LFAYVRETFVSKQDSDIYFWQCYMQVVPVRAGSMRNSLL